jgi:hypothetical protein
MCSSRAVSGPGACHRSSEWWGFRRYAASAASTALTTSGSGAASSAVRCCAAGGGAGGRGECLGVGQGLHAAGRGSRRLVPRAGPVAAAIALRPPPTPPDTQRPAPFTPAARRTSNEAYSCLLELQLSKMAAVALSTASTAAEGNGPAGAASDSCTSGRPAAASSTASNSSSRRTQCRRSPWGRRRAGGRTRGWERAAGARPAAAARAPPGLAAAPPPRPAAYSSRPPPGRDRRARGSAAARRARCAGPPRRRAARARDRARAQRALPRPAGRRKGRGFTAPWGRHARPRPAAGALPRRPEAPGRTLSELQSNPASPWTRSGAARTPFIRPSMASGCGGAQGRRELARTLPDRAIQARLAAHAPRRPSCRA